MQLLVATEGVKRKPVQLETGNCMQMRHEQTNKTTHIHNNTGSLERLHMVFC